MNETRRSWEFNEAGGEEGHELEPEERLRARQDHSRFSQRMFDLRCDIG